MARAQKRQRKKERQRQRIEAEVREWRTRRRRRLTINLGVLVVVVGALAFTIYSATREEEEPKAPTVACGGTKPTRKQVDPFSEPPPMSIDQAKTYTAVMRTSCGVVEIELADDAAPNTVNSFVFLANSGFFDGLDFHRLAQGFVVQGGDPEGSGSGGPGYQVVEAPPPLTEYKPGVVAMAKTGSDPPGASGSQFFIVSGDQGIQLNGTPEKAAEYALLGTVTKGLDAVAKMEKVGIKGGQGPDAEKPKLPIYIISITIRES